MKLSLRQQGLLPRVARVLRGAGALASRLRAWVWASLLGRVAAAVVALVVLAAIGRSAHANAPTPETPSAPALPPEPAPIVGSAEAPDASPSPAAPAESSPADAAAAASPVPRGRATPDDPVFLNSATQEDLRRLPGIGAKRADAILALRARLGRFRQIEDLLKVRGVGRAMLRKLRPLVRIAPS